MQLQFINHRCDLIMKFFELTIPESGCLCPSCLLVCNLEHIDNFPIGIKFVIDYFWFEVNHPIYYRRISAVPAEVKTVPSKNKKINDMSFFTT